MANPLYDIAVYTIERDGYLTGVFSNPGVSNKVCREVLIKKDGNNDVEGLYDCSYQSHNNKTYRGELSIKREGKRYQFDWIITFEDENPVSLFFNGAGYDRPLGRIAVYYRQ